MKLPYAIAACGLCLFAFPMPFFTYQWIGLWGVPLCIVGAAVMLWLALSIPIQPNNEPNL